MVERLWLLSLTVPDSRDWPLLHVADTGCDHPRSVSGETRWHCSPEWSSVATSSLPLTHLSRTSGTDVIIRRYHPVLQGRTLRLTNSRPLGLLLGHTLWPVTRGELSDSSELQFLPEGSAEVAAPRAQHGAGWTFHATQWNVWQPLSVPGFSEDSHLDMLESGEALVARVSSGPSATGGEGSAAPRRDRGGKEKHAEQVEGVKGEGGPQGSWDVQGTHLLRGRRDLGGVCCQVVMCLLSLASHKVFSNSAFLYVVM